jgi:UDP-glucose 6-dehydrogenase
VKASVLGLGYVVCVSAVYLAQHDHWVIGVGIDGRRVKAITEGHAPFFEPGIGEDSYRCEGLRVADGGHGRSRNRRD